MNLNSFLSLLLSSQAPWLPDAALQRWGLYVAWSVVLGTLTFQLATMFRLRLRGWLALAVASWSLWSAPASPTYWLGLAFQSPSLMSVALCVIWTASSLNIVPVRPFEARQKTRPSVTLACVGMILGWLLLGDMLALWPVSIYAWGFSTAALARALAFALWVFGCTRIGTQVFTLAFLLVLCLFVVTRLPSGNLWDALIDPWLWIVLQVNGLLGFFRRRHSRQI